MLEELTAYRTFGSAAHLAEIAHVVADGPCSFNDLFVIAKSSSTVEIPRIEAAVALLRELDLCAINGKQVVGDERVKNLVQSATPTGVAVGLVLLDRMFDEKLISVANVQYDLQVGRGYLRRSDVPLRYSQMRNYLIDAGIFAIDKGRIYLSEECAETLENKIAALEGGMTPEELLEKLERDRTTGAEAEAFVVEYEKRRLGPPLDNKVRQISLISVSAGYDVASFESVESTQFDRFIEVKAFGGNEFHISANELTTARRLGKRYYLYLVDMRKQAKEGYAPEIIQDPANRLADSVDWRVIPESYRISRIDL